MEPWKQTAYILGELDEPERLEVEHWIAQAPQRGEMMKDLATNLGRTERLLGQRAPLAMPPLAAPWDDPVEPRTVPWRSAMVAAAVVGAVGFVGWWFVQTGQGDHEPTAVTVGGTADASSAPQSDATRTVSAKMHDAATPRPIPPAAAVGLEEPALGPNHPEAVAEPSASLPKPASPTAEHDGSIVAKGTEDPVVTTVRCTRAGKPLKAARVTARWGSREASDTAGALIVRGHRIGDLLSLTCQADDGSRGTIEHRVNTARESVYLPVAKKAATKRETRRKKSEKGMGKLVIRARPWAKCRVGSEPPKTTTFSLELPGPKTYRVTCNKGSARKSKSVRIRPGKTSRVMFDFTGGTF